MIRARNSQRKQSFSTRISGATLDQLDELVRWGKYPNRTAAIEAAVARLANDAEEALERRRRAAEATRGALSLGMTSESIREAEYDRLDWEADRAMGRG